MVFYLTIFKITGGSRTLTWSHRRQYWRKLLCNTGAETAAIAITLPGVRPKNRDSIPGGRKETYFSFTTTRPGLGLEVSCSKERGLSGRKQSGLSLMLTHHPQLLP